MDTALVQNDSIINEFAELRQSSRLNDDASSQSSQEYSSETHYTKSKQVANFSDSEANSSKQADNYNNTINESYNTNYLRIEKLSIGETITLNETDTTQWKKIPGIGSSYSSRIVKYRELLGGYVRKEQLMEVYGIDNELYARIAGYIDVDSNYIKLNINELEFRDLLRHPYLNYKQVQEIVNLRDRKGYILLIDELAMLDEFTSEDIERLGPYLQF